MLRSPVPDNFIFPPFDFVYFSDKKVEFSHKKNQPIKQGCNRVTDLWAGLTPTLWTRPDAAEITRFRHFVFSRPLCKNSLHYAHHKSISEFWQRQECVSIAVSVRGFSLVSLVPTPELVRSCVSSRAEHQPSASAANCVHQETHAA
jgi:hypothetical protein